jgi:hypothetical protein
MSIRCVLVGPLAFLFAGAAIGQEPFQYVPGQQCIPLLYAKGQVRTDVAAQRSEIIRRIRRYVPIKGRSIKVAYALDDRWGLVGGFDDHSREVTIASGIYNSNGSPPVITYRHIRGNWTYGEIGAGRYQMFARNWIGEVYGLLGYGVTENVWPIGFRSHNRHYGLSVQANLGRSIGFIELAMGNRLRYLKIREKLSSSTAGLVDLQRQGSLLAWEPALMVRGGWKHVRLSFQAGYSAYVTGTTDSQTNLNLGLGLQLFFATKQRT